MTTDETIEHSGKIQDGDLYITNKRVILRRGLIITEASYRHISSIEYEKPGISGYLLAGICIVAVAIILYVFDTRLISMMLPNNIFMAIIGFGILLIIVGFLIKSSPSYKLYIVGREPIILKGHNLEDIIKVIRQYREHVDVS